MRFVYVLVGVLVFVYASIAVGFGTLAMLFEVSGVMNVSASGDPYRTFVNGTVLGAWSL